METMQQHELQTKAANLSLVYWTHFFLVDGAESSSARPGQLRNKAERQSFAEPTHAHFRGRARTQAPTTRNYLL